MRDFLPLTYGDLAVLLSSYPPDAPILVDFLSDPDWSKEFDTAPHTVGQVLDRCREMPRDGIPVAGTGYGPQLTVGMCFSEASPIVILVPAGGG